MEKALLVGLITSDTQDFEHAMEELENLATACEFEVVGSLTQALDHPIPATYIGSGKVEQICEMEELGGFDVVIFEDTLSPVQLKNLQKAIKARIMDRTGLILEIFSKRARTREAKLQVESANLQYMLPRLIGMWEAIGRQGGASGSKSSKGVGETQLELDRRWIQKRMSELRRELENIEHDRDIQRRKREKGHLPLVALVGYTNAGKSTIMNHFMRMSSGDEEKMVFEENMLFATLDTSVRKIETENKKDFLLSDTVGFLDKLPHSLIKAFRSTLDEIKYADLLLIVVDFSDERHEDQMKVTYDTLKELGADGIPRLLVYNKVDLHDGNLAYPRVVDDTIYMSARGEQDMDELLKLIQETVYSGNEVLQFLLPYTDPASGRIASDLNQNATILTQEYREDGTYIEADTPAHLAGKYRSYCV